jgi:hypothetical protein
MFRRGDEVVIVGWGDKEHKGIFHCYADDKKCGVVNLADDRPKDWPFYLVSVCIEYIIPASEAIWLVDIIAGAEFIRNGGDKVTLIETHNGNFYLGGLTGNPFKLFSNKCHEGGFTPEQMLLYIKNAGYEKSK